MTKHVIGISLALAITSVGCGPVVNMDVPKAEVDVANVMNDIAVTVTNDIGTVVMTFDIPIPEGSDDELKTALETSVSVIVKSPRSDISISLDQGLPVTGAPEQPGELSWALSEDRRTATLSFFNTTAEGLSLRRGAIYDVALTVSENEFISPIETSSFSVLIR